MRAILPLLTFGLAVVLLASGLPHASGQVNQVFGVGFQQVALGLTGPLFVTHAGDGSDRVFIVQQNGFVRVLRAGGLDAAPYLNFAGKISCCGERGLLGIAFDPNFEANGRLYVSYTRPDGASVLERLLVGDPANGVPPTNGEILLTVAQPFANHNGGWISFGPDGFLYYALGDGGNAGDPGNRAQNVNELLGKMLRLDVSGAVGYATPPGNPFAGAVPGRDEVWALGLRNPWRPSFDRQTGDLWIADVGQNLNEEVNLQPAGAAGGVNYGWRAWEGHLPFSVGQALSPAGLAMTFPVAEYTHGLDCSVTGGYVYRGPGLPNLQGRYVYGDFCSGIIRFLEPSNGRFLPLVLTDTVHKITSFGEDEQGRLYYTHYGNNGAGQGSVFRFV